MMKNKLFNIIAAALAAVLMVTALVYYNFIDKASDVEVNVGDNCPVFSVNTYKIEDGKFTSGGEIFSSFQNKGKVLVINFWATWCAPCKAELPYFNQLQEAFKEDVVVIALNGETMGEANLADWLNNGAPNDSSPVDGKWNEYSMLFGKYDESKQDLYKMLGFTGAWPSTMIVDKEGVVSFVKGGSMHYEDLEEQVLPLI